MEVLKEGEAGLPVAELCLTPGLASTRRYFNRKSKYSSIECSELQRLRETEAGNAKFEPMYVGLTLENAAVKEGCSENPEVVG